MHVAAVAIAVLAIGALLYRAGSPSNAVPLSWSTFQQDLTSHDVKTVVVDRSSGAITGSLRNRQTYQTIGPSRLSASQTSVLERDAVTSYARGGSSTHWPLVLVVMALGLFGVLVSVRGKFEGFRAG
jgi:hypothetical protein